MYVSILGLLRLRPGDSSKATKTVMEVLLATEGRELRRILAAGPGGPGATREKRAEEKMDGLILGGSSHLVSGLQPWL